MDKILSYKDLVVWQKSMELVENVYRLTLKLPQAERRGLMSQMRGAAVSVPSNIAEGAGRESKKEFSQFLSVSLGSCFEAETQSILAFRLGYISPEELKSLSENSLEIQKMIFGLKKSLMTRLGLVLSFFFTF